MNTSSNSYVLTDAEMPVDWQVMLAPEFEKEYFQNLSAEIRQEYMTQTIYPPSKDIFRAFDLCPFDEVKVVIIGQDPYHGPKQANGLCFAIHDGIAIPPSLKNIFKEIENDLGVIPFQSGDLSRWAKQGVLMLNSVLTVRAHQAASHKGKGWEQFTDAVVKKLNAEREGIVYLLWGRYAKEKGAVVDRQKNLVLTSAHPSPLSATKFFGNHHFSWCNEYLKVNGKESIDWR
jgi:uracil-DNA glycosylase